MERKLGQIFEYDGVNLEVAKDLWVLRHSIIKLK